MPTRHVACDTAVDKTQLIWHCLRLHAHGQGSQVDSRQSTTSRHASSHPVVPSSPPQSFHGRRATGVMNRLCQQTPVLCPGVLSCCPPAAVVCQQTHVLCPGVLKSTAVSVSPHQAIQMPIQGGRPVQARRSTYQCRVAYQVSRQRLPLPLARCCSGAGTSPCRGLSVLLELLLDLGLLVLGLHPGRPLALR